MGTVAKGRTVMEVGADGVALITIINPPPVNSLSFDGTQRLPRLVGLSKALEMILMSKPIKGEEAYTLGLVDAVISPDDLVNTARQWALDILDRRRPWVSTLYKTDKLEPLREAREILKFARAQAQNQSPNVKHPLVCIGH